MSKIKKGLLPVVALATCCGLAACGSSSPSSTRASASAVSAGTPVSTRGDSARRAALVACLKKHGVTLPARPQGAPPANGYGGPPAGGYGGPPAHSHGGGPRFFGGWRAHGFAPDPKLRAAFQACGGDRFRGRFRGGPPRDSATFRAALTKYVACVRQHGYDLPKPNLSGKSPIFLPSIQRNPKFQAASRACQNLLARPGGPPGGAPGGSSSSQTTTTSRT
jgi:hypothetical protein